MKDGEISTMLELAAKAARVTRRSWNPLNNSGDCADMCAALGIDTIWYGASVDCDGPDAGSTELYASHNNNRAAAWRMAALRVAAEIGRAKS